jgi:GMP synthase-like glutamine amidotransferase
MKLLTLTVTTDTGEHFTLFSESEKHLRKLGFDLVWMDHYQSVELLGPDTEILGRLSEETNFQWMTLKQIAAEIVVSARSKLGDRP